MKKNKESRRNFLKTAAFGALGTSALIAGLGTTEKALARFLSRKEAAHVGEFLEKVAAGRTSDEIDASFLKTVDDVMKLASQSREVQNGINTIGEYFAGAVDTQSDDDGVPPLGLSKAVSNALTCAYLASSRGFDLGPVSAEVLGKHISRPEEVLAKIERGFTSELIPAIEERRRSDRGFQDVLTKGDIHLQKVYETLERSYPEEMRIICRINGRRVPCWLWGVVVVVVVVVVVLTK